MTEFRLAEWISEVDNDDDGTCFYLCEHCDGKGDGWNDIKHFETCPVGEIQRLSKANDELRAQISQTHRRA